LVGEAGVAPLLSNHLITSLLQNYPHSIIIGKKILTFSDETIVSPILTNQFELKSVVDPVKPKNSARNGN
jgi:hypothetical protein